MEDNWQKIDTRSYKMRQKVDKRWKFVKENERQNTEDIKQKTKHCRMKTDDRTAEIEG